MGSDCTVPVKIYKSQQCMGWDARWKNFKYNKDPWKATQSYDPYV